MEESQVTFCKIGVYIGFILAAATISVLVTKGPLPVAIGFAVAALVGGVVVPKLAAAQFRRLIEQHVQQAAKLFEEFVESKTQEIIAGRPQIARENLASQFEKLLNPPKD